MGSFCRDRPPRRRFIDGNRSEWPRYGSREWPVDLRNHCAPFLSGPTPVTKVITFSDVRWTAISYRRGIAAYRALSLARTSRILFLGCGFAPVYPPGKLDLKRARWQRARRSFITVALPLGGQIYQTLRSELRMPPIQRAAPVQRRHSTVHG